MTQVVLQSSYVFTSTVVSLVTTEYHNSGYNQIEANDVYFMGQPAYLTEVVLAWHGLA